jgi:hypothetical protein
MAIVLSGPVRGTFDPNFVDGAGGFALLGGVNNNINAASNLIGPRPMVFVAEGTSVGNEAVTLALLAPINLTALGVTFPANSMRNIRTRVWSRRAAAASAGFCERLYTVNGAATPTIAPDGTIAAQLAAINENARGFATPNNNSAAAPEYGTGIVIMDAVATTNVIVGVQNILATTNAAVTATLIRWKLEVLVDALVSMPAP